MAISFCQYCVFCLSICTESSPVTNLTAVAINPELIVLSWDLPDYPNGPLVGYRIFYKKSNYTTFPPGADKTGYESRSTHSVTETGYNISGLTPSTNYTIFVEALGINNLGGKVDLEVLVLTRRGRIDYFQSHTHIYACAMNCKITIPYCLFINIYSVFVSNSTDCCIKLQCLDCEFVIMPQKSHYFTAVHVSMHLITCSALAMSAYILGDTSKPKFRH